MSVGPLQKSLEPVRQLAAAQFFAGWDDRRLLERFLAERDQAAFAELVQRQRRLVWSVCRHLLGQDQDAEDAFQATFLVLALKGRSIRKRQALASWLHGVAYRCAMQIKRQQYRRQGHEQRAARDASVDPAEEINLRELWAILEEEIQRLPEKHRMPFVLCCLEGKSQEEASRVLGWTTGTVSGRLARARKELQKRLARKGVQLPAVLAATSLGSTEVSAAVIAATLRGAVAAVSGTTALSGAISANVLALVKGVSQAMFLSKIKTATVVLVLAGLVAASGLTAQQAIFKDRAGGKKQTAAEGPKDPLVPPKTVERNDELRYDGKPFEYWRNFATNELKAERRIEALRAMGAFGARGYATESATVIVNLIKEYGVDQDIQPLFHGGGGGTHDQKVVYEALLALGKIGTAAVPVLLKNMEPDNVRTLVTLLFAHEGMRLPESSVSTVMHLLLDGKKEVQNAALEILAFAWQGGVPNETHWRAIVAAITDEETAKRLVRSLSRIVAENPRAVAEYRSEPYGVLRERASEILGRLDKPARAAGPALVKAALAGSDAAREAVLKIKPDPKVVVPLAAEGLRHNFRAQAVAITLLRSLGPEARPAVPALVAALIAPDPVPAADVQANQLAIIATLEKIGPDKDQVVPALAKILADKNQVFELQNKAFGLLRKIETQFDGVVPALAAFLDRQLSGPRPSGPTAPMRGNPMLKHPPGLAVPGKPAQTAPVKVHQLLEIFQKLGPKASKAMPVLLRTFKHFDDDPPTQLALIKTWTKMGTVAREALPVLYQMLANTENDPDEETRKLREAASDAIKKISK